jgi:hypothetical protein
MKRFILFLDGKSVGSFTNERVARFRFLKVCAAIDLKDSTVVLVDLELDGKTIAEY